MTRFTLAASLLMTSLALGQAVPASRAATGAPGGVVSAASTPKNIDRALEASISLDARDMPFETLVARLRELTQANIAVNWNAFSNAGVARDTPLTIHLKDVTVEQALRTLMEVLPTTKTQANYTIAENALEITTNSTLATNISSHMYDVTRAISYTFDPPIKAEEMLKNATVFDSVVRSELARVGDPPDAKDHSLVIKDNVLAATVSERGQGFINRALNMFNRPLKVGQLAMGTQFTVFSKRASDAYKALRAASPGVTPAMMAKDPGKYGQFNIALLPGTTAELAKAKPDIDLAINDGGVLLLGPRAAIRERTSLAIYDLQDVMKKIVAKSKIKDASSADVETAIIHVLQTGIEPEGDTWGGIDDLGKKPAIMIPYKGLLIVFATAETHRTIAGALQDMNK